MTEYPSYKLAISKAGHDKDRIYVIIREDGEYVYLSDGIYRPLDNCKRKNKKHIQIVKHFDTNLLQKQQEGTVSDEDIKRVIKRFVTKQ